MLNKVAATFFFFAFSMAANASIITDVDIDFRTVEWSGAWGQNIYSYGGVTVSALPSTKTIYQDSVDGLGILGGEPDEINLGEMMNISFNYKNSNFLALTGVWITDLFDAPDGGDIYGEEGMLQLTLADGSVFDYSFLGKYSDQANGEQYIDFGSKLVVTNALFQTNGVAGNEFSIAGFTAVIEGSSLYFFGIGMLLLSFYRRKRFFKI